MFIYSECPPRPPSPGHLCAPPAGALECMYNTNLCCCGHCPQNFTVSCTPDSFTGAGIWQSTLCPADGCGSEGELSTKCCLGTNFALGEGVLTSPNYPGAYPNNYQRTQVLKAESGKILRLEFTDFHVNSQVLGTCRFDYVTITDGDGTLLMDKTCGQPPFLPPVIMTLTNTVEVHFYTDTNGAGYGWSLSWAAVTPGLFANSALAEYCITLPC